MDGRRSAYHHLAHARGAVLTDVGLDHFETDPSGRTAGAPGRQAARALLSHQR